MPTAGSKSGSATEPGGQPSQAFPKNERIRKRAEYLRIQGSGRKLESPSFLVFVAPSPPGETGSRVGITVSRRVGHAVTRNRVKRLVREVVRRHKAGLPRGHDVVFVAKRAAADIDYARLKEEIERLCIRHFARMR